jgi:hypothetical protein
LTVADVEALPYGLDGVYGQYWLRIRDYDSELFDSEMKPLLKLLVCMQEPLEFDDVVKLLRTTEHKLNKYAAKISAMFPLRVDNGQTKFNIYHKSVTDFLLGAISKSVPYFDVNGKSKKINFSIPLAEAHLLFAQCLLQQIPLYFSQSLTEQSEALDSVSDYSVSHLSNHCCYLEIM